MQDHDRILAQNPTTITITISSEEKMRQFGVALARILETQLHDAAQTTTQGVVFSLVGTLGAGKTRLVQAIAVALGVADDEIMSPTFVLLREYATVHCPIYHFDLYRLETADEFARLAPEEYFSDRALSFVEWGDKFPQLLPDDHICVEISIVDEQTRTLTFSTAAPRWENLVQSVEVSYSA